MLTGITATIRSGYTGHDHLIDSEDRETTASAVAGVEFRRAMDALRAARAAYRASSDPRCHTARVEVVLRTARGDRITLG